MEKIGQGMYVLCEWDSVCRQDGKFQRTLAALESQMRTKCDVEWAPKTFNLSKALSAGDENYGRTTILPALFDDHAGLAMNRNNGVMNATWRQRFALANLGHGQLLAGVGAGNTIPEDIKVAWAGLAFPNKNQNITELKWQIGDTKYGRINIEEIQSYNKPALVFENGFILDGEQSFELYGYLKGPIPESENYIYQRIVMLGAAYYKYIDKVLGVCGSMIT